MACFAKQLLNAALQRQSVICIYRPRNTPVSSLQSYVAIWHTHAAMAAWTTLDGRQLHDHTQQSQH